MRTLLAACDSFVSLHRSEGFGVMLLEAMAFGKPCIATGFSGNLDYMSEGNSLLVPYKMRRVQRHEYPFGEGQWWAEPLHDAAVAAMRDVVRGSASVHAMAEAAKSETLVNYALEAVGERAAAIFRGERAPFVP